MTALEALPEGLVELDFRVTINFPNLTRKWEPKLQQLETLRLPKFLNERHTAINLNRCQNLRHLDASMLLKSHCLAIMKRNEAVIRELISFELPVGFTSIIPFLNRLENIQRISMETPDKREILLLLRTLPTLRSLELRNSSGNLTSLTLDAFQGVFPLRRLSVEGAHLHRSLQYFGTCFPFLEELRVWNCQFETLGETNCLLHHSGVNLIPLQIWNHLSR